MKKLDKNKKFLLATGVVALIIIADNVSISYIPLSITFLTIFIGTMGEDKTKGIKWISLIATVLIVLCGCIIYTIQGYGIYIDDKFNKIYIKVVFGCIGVLSLILSILYIKRICELK